MADLVLSTEQDVEDLAWGACFQGIGGGGPVAEGTRLLKKALAEYGPVRCQNPADFPDDAWVGTVSFMGNRAPLTLEQEEQKKRLGLVEWKYDNNLAEALKFLEKVTGRVVSGIVPSELGGANSPGPLSVALSLGLTPLDGDYTGKAKPETRQGMPSIAGVPLTPMASADKWGNKCVIYEAVNNALGERLGKMLATGAFGNTAVAYFLIPGREMKKHIFAGTLTESFELGRAMRLAREAGRDVTPVVLERLGGRVLFRGVLARKEWSVPDGYYVGTHEFEGEGEYAGHRYKVWFKNENHVTWFDGRPHVTTPDRVGQILTDTGLPVMTQELAEGQRVTLIGVPSRARHREPDALAFMAPRHYGFDIDYVPMERVAP